MEYMTVVTLTVSVWTTLLSRRVESQAALPKPYCFGPNDSPNWVYESDATGAQLYILPYVNVRLVCSVDTSSNNEVTPVWSNGDTDIPQRIVDGLALITITTSLQDDGDILTCTTQSDNGETGPRFNNIGTMDYPNNLRRCNLDRNAYDYTSRQ